jgi:vacuolar-type H+-ATPase subunit I/STV1
MKIVLLAVCAVLLAATVFLYSSNQKINAELVALRLQSSETETLRAEIEQIKKSQADSTEVARLRLENKEVYKLRNEVAQLTKLKQQVARSIQQAPTTEGTAFTPEQIQQLVRENQQLRSEQEEMQTLRERAHTTTILNTCIGNLKQMDGAKEQWALENRKNIKDVPTENELIGPGGYIRAKPVCPAGGIYSLNSVGTQPSCSIPGHVLPQ